MTSYPLKLFKNIFWAQQLYFIASALVSSRMASLATRRSNLVFHGKDFDKLNKGAGL
jgi:hypothetical protein